MVETLLDSYSEANRNQSVACRDHHPSDAVGFHSAGGQSFTTPAGTQYKLTSCKFFMRRVGSPTGTAYANLYAHTGTYGTSSEPTGIALATSDGFDVSTLTTTYTLYTLTFTGAEQYTMSTSTYYGITFENPAAGTIDADNNVQYGIDTTSPTHDGNLARYTNGSWHSDGTDDSCFYVYGEAVGQNVPEKMHHYGTIHRIIRG